MDLRRAVRFWFRGSRDGAPGGTAPPSIDANDLALPERTSSPMAIPIFRAVWIASLVSNFGALIQLVAAAWMMTILTASPVLIALVQSSTTLPLVLLSLWSGAVADNLDRRIILIVAQLFMLATSLLLALVAWEGGLTPSILLLFTFAIGCGTALNSPAWQASVSDMVPRSELPAVVAYNSMGFNMARSFGPAVGGAIIAAWGVAAAFLINALSYMGLIAVLIRWRPPRVERLLLREPIGSAMRAGIRYVLMSPALSGLMARAAFFGVGAAAIPALLPIAAKNFAGSPWAYGLLLGALGGGAVVGASVPPSARRRYSAEASVTSATFAVGMGTIVFAVSEALLLSCAAIFVVGAGWLVTLSTFNVTVQLAAPRWVVARALAIYQTMAFGGMTVGSWLFGWIAERASIETSLVAVGLVILACLAGGHYRPLRETEARVSIHSTAGASRAWRSRPEREPVRSSSRSNIGSRQHARRGSCELSRNAAVSGCGMERATGSWYRILRTPKSGSSSFLLRHGWSMSGTISAAPRRMPGTGPSCAHSP